ncbi:SDR family NAD(P)-dependent oxidoreductase [Xanthocytophaga agilis]|uniref:SDR family NAD(P)-dependent oxidoreductase n=1 Tax=Xanthocytophaga agilis TaxID=3048010 RepID=A0AAE3RAX3_9BACT|nr:SDR family NAD(P)-dependent oxidoreductase [Xanthocytophaga agilis]MDJ1506909.1 SDR family NAD(P)-dependent oxidoreductase [Xanthocytophaga agilis]
MSYTLITGASGSSGEATAREFAAKKHNVVLVVRNESKLKQLCNELSESHAVNAEYIVADLSSPSSPQQLFDESQTSK